MSLVKWGFIGLLALPVAEMPRFIVVAMTIGWFWAPAPFSGHHALGLMVLRRSGRATSIASVSDLTAGAIDAIQLESPWLGPMIGGILLVFPGFITDIAGALLLAPGGPARNGAASVARSRETRRRRASPRSSTSRPTSGIRFPKSTIEDESNQTAAVSSISSSLSDPGACVSHAAENSRFVVEQWR